MTIIDIIRKKRDGGAHTEAELRFLVEQLETGHLDSYHLAAWLMAVWIRGMTDQETELLTQVMVESGDQIDLSSIDGIPVDKHSTGGVGDGTSLLLAPIVAAAGGKVAKMSGRGLGHTGGTLDKLEAIPGMRVDLSADQFLAQVRKIGLAIISQTGKLVPADGHMYALRDVTATVDSIPLIASSVMSKKLACGAQAILLDVKFGDGAFMKSFEDAHELARLMVAIGSWRGRTVQAALSSMEQPLGTYIGNALEVKETLQILRNEKSGSDLAKVACELAEHLLVMAKLSPDLSSARQKVRELVESGQALDRMRQMIEAQGGDPRVTEDLSLLPHAPLEIVVESPSSGYLQAMRAEAIGNAAMVLGAGRLKKTDPVDPAVGIILEARVGQRLEKGQALARLYARTPDKVEKARQLVCEAAVLGEQAPTPHPLIREFVTAGTTVPT